MAKTTPPVSTPTPTTQTGPAQGADPSVVIARPDGADVETSAATLKELSEDNGAGPRQEPVHRQTVDVGAFDEDPAKQPKAGEKGAEHIVALDGGNSHETSYAAAPQEPEKPKKHGKTTDEDVDALAAQLLKALETQSVTVGGDGYGRAYEFYTTTMNNQAVVMAVVKRGAAAAQIPVSTAQLSLENGLDAAKDAIRALDGMLV